MLEGFCLFPFVLYPLFSFVVVVISLRVCLTACRQTTKKEQADKNTRKEQQK
jgi:hypothetical protein